MIQDFCPHPPESHHPIPIMFLVYEIQLLGNLSWSLHMRIFSVRFCGDVLLLYAYLNNCDVYSRAKKASTDRRVYLNAYGVPKDANPAKMIDRASYP